MEGRGLGKGKLLPTFVTYWDNWISAVKMSICQFSEIVLGFLARVVRANPVREQVTIVMSEKSFFQSRCLDLEENVTCPGTKIRRVCLFSATKNKELVAFTRV